MQFPENSDRLELKRCWSLLHSRWRLILLTALSCMGLSTWFVSQQDPAYEASGRLLIRSEQTAALTGLDVNLGELHSLGSYQKDPLDTQLQLLRSAPVVQAVIHRLDLRHADGQRWTTVEFLQQLKTEVIRGTDVLQVSFLSEEPAIALSVVHELIRAYLENNVLANRQEAVSARLFIEQQLPESERAVRLAEAQLSQFKYKHQIITLEEEATQAIRMAADIERQKEETRIQLADVNARVEQLRQQIGLDSSEAINASVLSEAASVQDTLEQIQVVESQLIREQAKYQQRTPVIEQLETEARNLKQLLQTRVDQSLETSAKLPMSRLQVGPTKQTLIADFLELEVEAKGLENQLQSLSQVEQQRRSRAEALPALEQQQRELNRRLRAAQTTYENLLAKLEEVNAAEKQSVENARVIEMPSSAIQVENASQNAIVIGASGIVGSLLGVSVVFLLSAIGKPVRTIQKARELLNYELLGIIPAFDSRGRLQHDFYHEKALRVLERDLSSSVVQGSYHTVLDNLLVAAGNRQTKTLLITSATAGEGKSEVAANLAMALLRRGYRVLLIDANPRHPSQHQVWHKGNNGTGLMTLLCGIGSLRQEIQPIQHNFHLLTSGPDSAQTSLLLRSPAMENLLEDCAGRYDYVVLDGPSLAETDHAYSLGEVSAGVLLVIRPENADVDSVMAAQQGLQHLHQNILGMVINGVDIRVEPSSQLQIASAYSYGQYELVRP